MAKHHLTRAIATVLESLEQRSMMSVTIKHYTGTTTGGPPRNTYGFAVSPGAGDPDNQFSITQTGWQSTGSTIPDITFETSSASITHVSTPNYLKRAEITSGGLDDVSPDSETTLYNYWDGVSYGPYYTDADHTLRHNPVYSDQNGDLDYKVDYQHNIYYPGTYEAGDYINRTITKSTSGSGGGAMSVTTLLMGLNGTLGLASPSTVMAPSLATLARQLIQLQTRYGTQMVQHT